MLNLIKHGRIFLIISALFLLSSVTVSAGEISAELSRNIISQGETSVLKIMISGDTSDIRPLKMPAVKGLNISYTGSSKSFQFINGNLWSGIILHFSIHAEKSGVYKIPPFVIEAGGEKLSTSEVVLTVRKGDPAEKRSRVSYLRGDVELSSSRTLTGEPVVMRYYILFSGDRAVRIDAFSQQPEINGFILTDIDEQIPPSFEVVEGVEYEKIHAGTFLLTPSGPGDYSAGGGSLVVTIDGGRGFFSFPDQKQLKMPRRQIKVMPLPVKGSPPGFRGAIGDFILEKGLVKGETGQYEEIAFPISVEGKGNFLSLHQPVVNGFDGAKVSIVDEAPVFYLSENIPEGRKQFKVTIVPESSGEITGYFSLPYYDPYSGEYKVLKSEPVSIIVRDGAVADQEDVVISSEEESGIPLSGYLAIGGLVLLCIGALIYLFIRDKKISFKINGHEENNGNNKRGKNESEKVTVKENPLSELKLCLHRNDTDRFLRTAEKIADIIDSQGKRNSEIYQIKEKINLCRYGGAPLSSDEMKVMAGTLEKEFSGSGK